MCWTPLYKNNVNKICVLLSYKLLNVKTNRISFLCGIRYGHHNTRRTEYRFYAEFVTDITTQISEHKDYII
jgi:hypothetical protein